MSITVSRWLSGYQFVCTCAFAIASLCAAAAAAAEQTEESRPVGEIVGPPLIEAAKRGDLAGVKDRLTQGDAVDLRDQSGSTALVEAAWCGHADIVDLLIRRGAKVNMANQAGATALMGAAVHDEEEIAVRLLNAGAKVDASADRGRTALVLAAESNSTQVIAVLLKHGADVEAQAPDGSTPLVQAAACGQLAAVKTLLDAGAKVDAAAEGGQTPLIAAVENRRAEVVAELLARGADIGSTSPGSESALERARRRGDAEIVLLFEPLLEGTDPTDTAPKRTGRKNARSASPELVSSNVDDRDSEVDPTLTELVFTFDRPMNGHRYHLITVNRRKYGVFPELVGEAPIIFRDDHTLVLQVKLQPDTKYGLGMNDNDRLEFRSVDGVPLEPLIFYFRTKGLGE